MNTTEPQTKKQEVKHEKCGRCKTYRLPESFLNQKGRRLKSCEDCREREKKSRFKNKCEHGRRKSQCKQCGGSQICGHNRIKTECKPCGGSQICEHGRRKSKCKQCGGSQICKHNIRKDGCKQCGDAVDITIKLWIRHSRARDKENNTYDANNFIDKCFLEGLVEDSDNKCHYCKYTVQYITYDSNLATIERLDNTIGHIKSNCVIACKTCNCKNNHN